MQHNLTPSSKTVRVSNAVAAGATQINTGAVDTLGFGAVRFLALFGALTATQVTSIRAQHSDDNATWEDVEGSKTPNLADADGNKLLVLDIYRPQKRYVRLVVGRATANAVLDGAIAELYLPGDAPVAKDATVAAQKTLNGPASGVA